MGRGRILNPLMAFTYWSSLCIADLGISYWANWSVFSKRKCSSFLQRVPGSPRWLLRVSLPRLCLVYPLVFQPPAFRTRPFSNLAFSALASRLFLTAYSCGVCFRHDAYQRLWPPAQATQSWSLLPQFWDHPAGRRGSAPPRRPDDWQRPQGKCPAGHPEGARVPPPRAPLPLPARNKPFLQTHAINSNKISIFNTLYMNKDLPKEKKKKMGFYWESGIFQPRREKSCLEWGSGAKGINMGSTNRLSTCHSAGL